MWHQLIVAFNKVADHYKTDHYKTYSRMCRLPFWGLGTVSMRSSTLYGAYHGSAEYVTNKRIETMWSEPNTFTRIVSTADSDKILLANQRWQLKKHKHEGQQEPTYESPKNFRISVKWTCRSYNICIHETTNDIELSKYSLECTVRSLEDKSSLAGLLSRLCLFQVRK